MFCGNQSTERGRKLIGPFDCYLDNSKVVMSEKLNLKVKLVFGSREHSNFLIFSLLAIVSLLSQRRKNYHKQLFLIHVIQKNMTLNIYHKILL